jgi:hypothetical protein
MMMTLTHKLGFNARSRERLDPLTLESVLRPAFPPRLKVTFAVGDKIVLRPEVNKVGLYTVIHEWARTVHRQFIGS